MKYINTKRSGVVAEVSSDGTVIQGIDGKYEVLAFMTKEMLDNDPRWVAVVEEQKAPVVKRIKEVEEEAVPPKKKKPAKQVKEEVVEPIVEGKEE